MNKKQRKLIRCAVLVGIVVVFCIWVIPLFMSPASEERLGEIFEKDKELLKQVAEYLEKNQGYDIRIRGEYYEYGYMDIYNDPDTPFFHRKEEMNDREIKDTVDILLERYVSISKYGNSIFFHYSGGVGTSNGIAYAIDDELKNQFEDFASLKYSELSEEKWYYYERNFSDDSPERKVNEKEIVENSEPAGRE